MIRKWNVNDKQLNQKCVDEVIARIQEIDDPEQVGVVAAQDVIDIVLENAGPVIYNQAIDDVLKNLKEKFEEIEYATEDLRQ